MVAAPCPRPQSSLTLSSSAGHHGEQSVVTMELKQMEEIQWKLFMLGYPRDLRPMRPLLRVALLPSLIGDRCSRIGRGIVLTPMRRTSSEARKRKNHRVQIESTLNLELDLNIKT